MGRLVQKSENITYYSGTIISTISYDTPEYPTEPYLINISIYNQGEYHLTNEDEELYYAKLALYLDNIEITYDIVNFNYSYDSAISIEEHAENELKKINLDDLKREANRKILNLRKKTKSPWF